MTKNRSLIRKRMGLREMVRELNEKSVPTARGGKWHGRTIKYILENPIYKGSVRYKDNKVKNKELVLV